MPHVSLFLQSSWLQDCKRHPKTWSRKPWWFKCRLPGKLQWHKFGPCVLHHVNTKQGSHGAEFFCVGLSEVRWLFSETLPQQGGVICLLLLTLKMLRMQKYTRADDNDILKWKHFIIFPLQAQDKESPVKQKQGSLHIVWNGRVGPDGCSKEPFD